MAEDDPLDLSELWEATPLDTAPLNVHPHEEGDAGEKTEPRPELVYGSVDEWLREYWRYSYRRRVSGKGSGTGRWKAVWWNSDEAVQRLTALWRGWEAARLDPGLGMSQWWINHADPQMAVLLSLNGPFAGSADENQPGEPLPYQEPPAGLFLSAREVSEDQ